jgi:hypothetical protein
MKMPFVTILSQANESSGEGICRPCGVIIQASRLVLTSGEFSEKVVDHGIHNHLPGAAVIHRSIMESLDGKVFTRHSISRIPSRRQPGGASGFNGSREAALRRDRRSAATHIASISSAGPTAPVDRALPECLFSESGQ